MLEVSRLCLVRLNHLTDVIPRNTCHHISQASRQASTVASLTIRSPLHSHYAQPVNARRPAKGQSHARVQQLFFVIAQLARLELEDLVPRVDRRRTLLGFGTAAHIRQEQLLPGVFAPDELAPGKAATLINKCFEHSRVHVQSLLCAAVLASHYQLVSSERDTTAAVGQWLADMCFVNSGREHTIPCNIWC